MADAAMNGWEMGWQYRAACRGEALRLGVTGYARNLTDGSVEVLVCGEQGAVNAMEAWLWRGPSLARVRSVIVLDLPVSVLADRTGFRVE